MITQISITPTDAAFSSFTVHDQNGNHLANHESQLDAINKAIEIATAQNTVRPGFSRPLIPNITLVMTHNS